MVGFLERSSETASLSAIRKSHGPRRRCRRALVQRGQRARHRGLKDVLRVVLVVHDRAAIAVERLVMALVQGAEGPLVAPRGEAHEPLVPEDA